MLVTSLVMSIGGIIGSFYISTLHALPFILGVILTTCLNIVKVIWLERAVNATVNLEDQKAAARQIRLHYVLRLLLTLLVLLAAVFIPFIDLWGAVVGLFTFHPAKYALGVFIKTDDL